MVDGKIRSFEDLVVWQESQNLAVMIYRVTRNFPAGEVFGITSQMKRSSTSVSANIAEGFGRKTLKDKTHFYTMAYGSLLEIKNFIYLCRRLDFFDIDQQNELLEQITSCQKLLNAFTRSLK